MTHLSTIEQTKTDAMALAAQIAAPPSQSFQFCGRSFLAFVLKPELPIGRWMSEADAWLSRSPGFFAGKPVVVDVSGLAPTKPKVAELIADLGARNIRVMGMVGADHSLSDPALPPVLSLGRSAVAEMAQKAPEPQPSVLAAPAPAPSSLHIDSPVRSGQCVFHEGDVTVIGSVSSGAEIVATGSIHIYGTLRGRVMAGADGNSRAHIFCRRVEAELIAIDGYYRMADEMDAYLGKPIHAWLEDGTLAIKTLD
jgi:septum site-determining protein MinC